MSDRDSFFHDNLNAEQNSLGAVKDSSESKSHMDYALRQKDYIGSNRNIADHSLDSNEGMEEKLVR